GADLRAQRIAVQHVVSGPVTRVDVAGGEIDVVGQTVRLSSVTRSGDGVAVASAFPLDAYVEVSGMRRADGVVVASRGSRVEPRDLVELVGPVAKVDGDMLWITGTAVRSEGPPAIPVGDEVRVAGHWDGNAIVAYSITSMPQVPFDGQVARVDIEGFARP